MIEKMPSKSRYFLVELVINTLFFVLCASVSLSLFARGFSETHESRALSMATLSSQNVAEIIKATEGDFTNFEDFADVLKVDNKYYAYFDDEWTKTNDENDKNIMIIQNENDGSLLLSNISVYQSEQLIYSLDVTSYVGGDFND